MSALADRFPGRYAGPARGRCGSGARALRTLPAVCGAVHRPLRSSSQGPGERGGTERPRREQAGLARGRVLLSCASRSPRNRLSPGLGACCEVGEAARAAPHRSRLWTVVVARHLGFDFLRAQEDSLQLFRLETFLVECKPLHLTFSAL